MSVRGTYALVLRVPRDLKLKTRSKRFHIEKGVYVYVGSALLDLESRLRRHESREKRKFWHIDFLLAESELIFAVSILSPHRLEDHLVSLLHGSPVPGFGASDSPLPSHLFRYESVEEALSDVFRAAHQTRQGGTRGEGRK